MSTQKNGKPPSAKGQKAAARAREEKKRDPARHWQRRVLAAHLIMCGLTQKQVAALVGRSDRVLRDWMSSPTWNQAREEAKELWYNGTEDAARGAVFKSISAGNAELGFRFLERVDPRLAPPKQTHEHGAVGGGPIQFLIAGPEHPTE